MMDGCGMMGGGLFGGFYTFLLTLLLLGLTILVYLWVVKIWRGITSKKR